MSVKIGKIALTYKNSIDNNREVARSKQSKPEITKPTTTQNSDQRLKSPRFRAAVRTVLEHLGYKMTMGNFRKHDKKYGAEIPFDWHAFARNIGNSSSSRIDDLPTGVYFQTHTGALIEAGKCLNSIKQLTEYNRRLKK